MYRAVKWDQKDFARAKKVYVTCGGDQERLLNRQLQRMLSSLGEVLCGDEKLFRFTGRGGIVRKVPRKPARIGIWHYQAVMLPTDDPFLAYASVHNTSGSLLITCPFMTSTKVCSPAVTSSISNSMERLSHIRLPTKPIWPKRKIFGIISSLLSWSTFGMYGRVCCRPVIRKLRLCLSVIFVTTFLLGLWRSCAFNVGLALVCLVVFWW